MESLCLWMQGKVDVQMKLPDLNGRALKLLRVPAKPSDCPALRNGISWPAVPSTLTKPKLYCFSHMYKDD